MATASPAEIEPVSSERREDHEQNRPREEQEAAFLNTFGHWKAFVGADEFSVRPLSSKDISWLFGAVAEVVEQKETQVVGELSSERGRRQPIEVVGREARQATTDSASAIKGEPALLTILYNSLYSGIQTKTPEIFVVAPEKVAEYLIFRHQSELKGTELDPTPTDSDPSSEGVNMCLVLTPEKGKEIESLLTANGHPVKPLTTTAGFQARLGGIRLAFFYSSEQHVEKEDTAEEKDASPALEAGGEEK